MNNNPSVTEICKKRAEILASYHGDYLAMMTSMKQNQWNRGQVRDDNQGIPPEHREGRRAGTAVPGCGLLEGNEFRRRDAT